MWIASSWRRALSDWGKHAKKPALESNLELKRRAADEWNVRTRWALNAEWAWLYTRRRETLEPRMAGNEWRAARTHARRRVVVERVR